MTNNQPRLSHRDTNPDSRRRSAPDPASLGKYLLDNDERLVGEYGPYFLLGPLGEGGMGMAYLAEHEPTGSLLVVKLAGNSGRDEHLEGEFNALTHFDHPNIVKAFDQGQVYGRRFLVMELLEGRDLHKQLEIEYLLDADVAAEIAIQTLRGLEAVHGAGLLHNDIKPANVFLAETPAETTVKLIDFGLCRTAEYARQNMISFGTPLYMSPELASASALDHRSDLYSVGVLLYRMLSGTDPFRGTDREVLDQTLHRDPSPLEDHMPGLPTGLREIVYCALEKDPQMRFRSAAAFRMALEDALECLGPMHSDTHALGAPQERKTDVNVA